MWNQEMSRVLYQIVYQKFNYDFWGDKERWKGYLDSVGMTSSRNSMPSEQGNSVQVICPTTYCPRIRNDLKRAGNLWIYIPMDLAVKIVTLGVMP